MEPETARLLGSFDFRKFQFRGCASVFVVLSYRRWRKCLSDIQLVEFWVRIVQHFFFCYTEKTKGKEQCKLHLWDRIYWKISKRSAIQRLVQFVPMHRYPFWITSIFSITALANFPHGYDVNLTLFRHKQIEEWDQDRPEKKAPGDLFCSLTNLENLVFFTHPCSSIGRASGR